MADEQNQETAVEKAKPVDVYAYIESKKANIYDMLPAHVNRDRFIKSAVLAVARDQKLQQCTHSSIWTCISNAAELGLDFTPAKRQAYMVPYWNNKKGVMEAQFMPGYGGLIELAHNSGKVDDIQSHIVFENDFFEIEYGTTPKFIHKPCIKGSRGDIVGAYAVAWLKDGKSHPEFMPLEELEGIRKRSKMGNGGPWITDTGEMYKKTTVRRLFKYIPSSPDDKLYRAIELDNDASGVRDEEAEVLDSKPMTRTASLAARLGVTASQETVPEHDEYGEVIPEPEAAEESKPDPEPEVKAATAAPAGKRAYTIGYGAFQNVYLTIKEVNTFVEQYGKDAVDEMIHEFGTAIKEKGLEGKYKDHQKTLAASFAKKFPPVEEQAGLGL